MEITRRPSIAAAALLALVAGACDPQASTPPGSASANGSIPASAPASAQATPAGTPPACRAAEPMPAAVPWWRTAVFYEVFVRSFGDADGDGIGDFEGLRDHLDDINGGGEFIRGDGLGATALWLMPILESPSYHGYDVTNYEAFEPDYGDLEQWLDLISRAHSHGLKVVIDFEANHTSVQHPWFDDAVAGGKHRDWYVWSETDPGWPNPIGAGDPWRPSESGFYYGVFWEGMPDLNLRNPAVTAELERVAKKWIDLGVDGFRIDAAKHLIEDGPDQQVNTPETHAWLQGFWNTVHATDALATNRTTLIVGEVADAELTSGSYTKDGSLDMAFDFEIGPAIANAVTHGDAASLLTSQAGIQKAYPNGGAGTFLSNHDQPRIMTQLRGDTTAAKLSAGTLLTAPGTPFIYYGEELGMTGTKPDELIRTPYPWTAADPGHGFTTGTPWEPFAADAATVNADSEFEDPDSLLTTYTDLIRVRREHPTLATAPFLPLESSNPRVAASVRPDPSGSLLVIQNLGADDAPSVTFRLRTGPLCGTPTAEIVLPRTQTGLVPVAPVVTPAGGLEGYVPLASIPGSSTIVLTLNP